MSSIPFDSTLNPDQLAAVTHEGGPQLVLAGAGSGKTRVITYRIAWLVQERGVPPEAIAAVTFTNKAAAEMRERVEGLLGLYPLPSFVGTFHRFALRLLRMYGERVGLPRGFIILDTADQMTLLKKALAKFTVSDRNFQPPAVLSAISGAKNQLLKPSAYERQAEGFFQQRVAPVYRQYQKLLREAGGVDFDDMILLAVDLLRDPEIGARVRARYAHLLVDEFQDTNHAQLTLVHELAGERRLITAVGDEDQSIYRWRGAEIRNILRFEESFPGAEVHKLERNYRSTQNILDASGAVVANNTGRRGKTLWTESGAGHEILLYHGQDEQDEARWTCRAFDQLLGDFELPEMAILVRTKAQTRAFEEELLRRKVPYTLVGGTRFYERAEIKDLVCYLRLVRNPRDSLALNRVLNQPPRGIGRTTHQHLTARADELGKPLWDVLHDDPLSAVTKRGRSALRGFARLIDGLREEADDLPLPALIRRALEMTSYAEIFDDQDAGDRARLENIAEFVSAAQDFIESHAYGSVSGGREEEDLLAAFLDHASLTASADEAQGGGLSLMTLHSAKGLEFDVVLVAGLEEDILPHFNSKTAPEDLEEERRLLYVGMTRARRRLLLSHCARRRVAGQYQNQVASRFLGEIPEDLVQREQSSELGHDDRREQRPQWGERRWSRDVDNVFSFFGQKKKEPAPAAPVPDDFPGGPDRSAEDDSPSTPPKPAPRVETPPPPSGTRPATELPLKRGSRIRHPSLGTGSILKIEGTGEAMRLMVYFDGIGRRKLIAKYAQLEML